MLFPKVGLPPLPSVAAYTTALMEMYNADAITEKQYDMLIEHYNAPNHTITASELAAAVGYKSYSGANLQYGLLGKNLRRYLNYQGDGQESYVLAHFHAPGTAGNEDWLFVMHPTVATALETLGWV